MISTSEIKISVAVNPDKGDDAKGLPIRLWFGQIDDSSFSVRNGIRRTRGLSEPVGFADAVAQGLAPTEACICPVTFLIFQVD